MQRFTSPVHVFNGRYVYEFLRLNLPDAFAAIPTLESYNNENKTRCSFKYILPQIALVLPLKSIMMLKVIQLLVFVDK
jgi:hypothetical protein